MVMIEIDRRSILAYLALVSACTPLAANSASSRAVVMVIPSMHGLHATSSYYRYEDLYAAVARFEPDRIGVEIRQEDLGRDDEYLKRNYPAEMIHLARAYADRVFGFDWLGDDLAGQAVPDDWWQVRSPIKKLEREWEAGLPGDEIHIRLKAKHDAFASQQMTILRDATISGLADGRYDQVTADYYANMRQLMAGTPYAALPAFYQQRDEKIVANILNEVRASPGARIVVVTGADHHGPIVAALAKHAGLVTLAPVVP